MSNQLDPRAHLLIDPGYSTVLVGQCKALRDAIHKARCIAEDPATVLVLGESGTGKEEVARGIHRLSHRPGHFVAVNCAALPADLAESLLFGHVKGAFTTADRDDLGLIRQSQHGTLFLDEVGELDLKLQSKLLRVLQERAVLPIGGKSEIAVDFRVVAATNRDLEAMVRSGEFRSDLRNRLIGWPIELPPFRNRGNDPLLVLAAFLEQEALQRRKRPRTMTPAAEAVFLGHPWRANGRELQQVAKALVLCGGGGAISAAEARGVLEVYRRDELEDEITRTLRLRISRGDGPTRAELCKELGRGKSGVCNKLNRLIRRGKVYRSPGGKAPRYFATPGGSREVPVNCLPPEGNTEPAVYRSAVRFVPKSSRDISPQGGCPESTGCHVLCGGDRQTPGCLPARGENQPVPDHFPFPADNVEVDPPYRMAGRKSSAIHNASPMAPLATGPRPLSEECGNAMHSPEERIVCLAEGGRVTTRAVITALQCSRATATRMLTKLKNTGRLEEHGQGSAVHYVIPRGWKAR